MDYEIENDLHHQIKNRYRFMYISRNEYYEIFNAPKLFYPFGPDDVFVEIINRPSMDADKKLVQFYFIFNEGTILAIHPDGKTTVLANLKNEFFHGRRFTLEMLGVKEFKYDGDCFLRTWYSLIDRVKPRVIKYFIPDSEYRNLSRSIECAICGCGLPNQKFAKSYQGIVCRHCESRAVNSSGERPVHRSIRDDGDNPIFIDGIECHRRYRFGGFITMKKLR